MKFGIVFCVLALLSCGSFCHAEELQPVVFLLEVAGPINPGIADFAKNGIQKGNTENAACIVITLDTPGGLSQSMRDIVMSILGSQIPVVVFVSPSGARAASAGVMITVAADIAAMAPGTNIGAAHPVGIGGKDIDKTMSDKITNDMVAYAKGIARKHGRNEKWIEKAIRESVSITETGALKEKVIDIIARDLDDLILQINGRNIAGKGSLKLDNSRIKVVEETLRTKILKTISDPNIAYLLLILGIAGLYFELSNPGGVFPGVIGGIAIILAAYSLQTLPVNYTGILLMILAFVLFILEIKITSYGLLSVAGIISLLLGSLMLFERGIPGISLSWTVFLPAVILISVFFIVVTGLVVKAQINKPRTGEKGLVGEIGIVKKALRPQGKVFVHGELWNAVSGKELPEGARIRVINVKNLKLEVEPLESDHE